VAAIEDVLAQAGVTWSQVCYMGDDVVDLGALKRAGVAVAPANATAEARAAADYVTKAASGDGAVREVAELILKSQKRWQRIVADYAASN
jgi:3-deoxy-D-manno-octulosonate 8-phosphate phosphatase (KDO 8-P phosphatase)